MNAILSSVDTSKSSLAPTLEYLSAGSTDRAHKSYYVGNALCAHAAYSELKIPWLVDIEQLNTSYKISWSSSGKRPDFLGVDTGGKWYVFESKGRTDGPTPADLKKWKIQATCGDCFSKLSGLSRVVRS